MTAILENLFINSFVTDLTVQKLISATKLPTKTPIAPNKYRKTQINIGRKMKLSNNSAPINSFDTVLKAPTASNKPPFFVFKKNHHYPAWNDIHDYNKKNQKFWIEY